MLLYHDKSECYGCGACMNACPKQAIEMKMDEEGFVYPVIDEKLCIDCGICKSRCQIHEPPAKSSDRVKVYAVQNKDEQIRANSTSGGAFSAFAEKTLQAKGAVYGAAYEEGFIVRHLRASSQEQYQRFRGSKYCQSDLNTCYQQVKADLQRGTKVLFSGTPCQIAGLKSYLGERSENENLLLLEIVCHGAPSPLMWKEHIQFLEKTRKAKVKCYKNRSKVAGWHGHNEHVFFENGKNEYKTKLSQNHKDLFYAHLIIRPSCYQCAYAGLQRVADISIADYWGIEKCMPEFDDNKGTSLVLVNTKRGAHFFESVKECFEIRESNLEDAFRDNHKKPAKRNINREKFWADYQRHGYLYVLQKYASYTTIGKAKRQIKIHIKELTRHLGIYPLIHKLTQKKYQGVAYK